MASYLDYMDSICISLGGSIISESRGLNVEYVREFAKTVLESDKRFVIVTGGGYTNKQYVTALRSVYGNEFQLDKLGIKATELNATFVKLVFESQQEGSAELCSSVYDIPAALQKHKAVITHGQLPGVTTDAIGVLACEATGSKAMINISNVPYIYDRPPEQEGARKLETMTHDDLVELANRYDTRAARSNFIFDVAACKFAKRSGIELRFIDTGVDNLRKAIAGSGYSGTTVKD